MPVQFDRPTLVSLAQALFPQGARLANSRGQSEIRRPILAVCPVVAGYVTWLRGPYAMC